MTTTAGLHPDLTWREVDETVLVLDLRSGKYLELNATGSVLWKRLAEGSADEDQLVAALQEEFEVSDEQARTDVTAFLASLRQGGLLA